MKNNLLNLGALIIGFCLGQVIGQIVFADKYSDLITQTKADTYYEEKGEIYSLPEEDQFAIKEAYNNNEKIVQKLDLIADRLWTIQKLLNGR